mmetsp:Transcript_7160/g.13247  ORF Transcript_7160/g.13247 Transcript_7160/m.13247 type:complete len:115 (-) Transcript_7160:1721-2065(-)
MRPYRCDSTGALPDSLHQSGHLSNKYALLLVSLGMRTKTQQTAAKLKKRRAQRTHMLGFFNHHALRATVCALIEFLLVDILQKCACCSKDRRGSQKMPKPSKIVNELHGSRRLQ